ncbi:hypothetical protein, partial [Kitasatospora aureofaciens]
MSSPTIGRILRGPTGLGTAGLQLRPQVPAPEAPTAAGAENRVVETVALEAVVARTATLGAAVPDVQRSSLPVPSLPVPSLPA